MFYFLIWLYIVYEKSIMSKLLLEIFSEEIPAKIQLIAIDKLTKLLLESIPYSNITHFISPRHICLSIDNFQLVTKVSIKGPNTSSDINQIDGFLKKHNIATVDELIIRNSIYFLEKKLSLEESLDSISKNISNILSKMVWPKSMTWNNHTLKWIRPIHSIACLIDNEVLPIKLGHITASNKTYGHRSQNSKEIILDSSDINDYRESLRKNGVIVSHNERKEIILNQILEIITPLNLTLISDTELLDEVVGLVENPKVFLGKIDHKFMSLPKELLIISLKYNQKYLLLNNAAGDLAPYFIIVSDILPDDEGKAIILGNEKVLNARLSDAQHFIKSDLQVSFESLIDKLHKIQFHKDVGSLYEKVMRIINIANNICNELGIDSTYIRRAAMLCKNDLVTGVVKEFPELQGIVGYYYSQAHGENEIVAKSIYDHYKPSGPNDSIPQTFEGCIVAIADKLDTINSLFAVGIKPTSTKDPYALRRAALGIIRIISSHELLINKFKLNASDEVIEFICERAKNLYKKPELDKILEVLKR